MGKTYLPNYEDGTFKRLYDLLSFITGLSQDSYIFPIISYQESAGLLARDSKILRLLSRDSKTTIKRLQHSYQEIPGLL